MLLQGEGGRIIRRENWLFGLKEGERLSYNVNILQNEDDEEDNQPDPTVASSGEHGAVDDVTSAARTEPGGNHTKEEDKETAASMLPITGEVVAEIWEDTDTSKVKDFEAGEFMEAEIGQKFYAFGSRARLPID